MKKKPIHSRIYKKNIITHCTCEDFYQKKMQRKQLLYFDNYVFGGHVDIKCKSFNVALIKFQLKNQNGLQKSHTFCSKLISTFFPRILAQCVVYVNFHRFAHNHLFKAYIAYYSYHIISFSIFQGYPSFAVKIFELYIIVLKLVIIIIFQGSISGPVL